ncbi:hypothetical protein ACVIRO_003104 [Rhizobium ruizarguesonis]
MRPVLATARRMRCGWLNAAATATGIGRHAPERSSFAFRSCARAAISQASSNRIKECQLDLYADRTSAHTMRANQLRLWFASLAYVLIGALRRVGLAHTRLADATCGTIRLKLLKIGAQVRVSVRRIKVAMASACPYAEECDGWGSGFPPQPDARSFPPFPGKK